MFHPRIVPVGTASKMQSEKSRQDWYPRRLRRITARQEPPAQKHKRMPTIRTGMGSTS